MTKMNQRVSWMEHIVNARLTKDLGFLLMTYKLQPHVCIVSVIASVIHIKPRALVSQPSIRHSLMKRRNTCQELSSQVETRWIPEKDSRLLSHILVVGVWWPWNKTHAPFTLDGKKKTPLTSVFDAAFAAFAHTSNDSSVVMSVYRLQLRSNGMKTQYPGWQVNSRLNISHHCSGKSDECCSLRLFENKFWRLLGVVRWGIWSGCFLFFIFDDEHDRSHLKKQKGKLVLWQGENHPFLRVYPWVKTSQHNAQLLQWKSGINNWLFFSRIACSVERNLRWYKGFHRGGYCKFSSSCQSLYSPQLQRVSILCLKHNDIITLTLTQDTAPISD